MAVTSASASLLVEDHGEYSIVRKGSIIYRGQTDAFDIIGGKAILKRSVLKEGHTYFGIDPTGTKIAYGITTAIHVQKDLKLLNIMKLDAWDHLRRQMTEHREFEARAALERAFPIVRGVVWRDSDSKLDFKVLEFICTNLDFNGYIQPTGSATTAMGGMLEGEIAICSANLHKVLEFIDTEALPPEDKSYELLKYELEQRKLKKQQKQRRELAKAETRFDDDDEPMSPIVKLLFE